MPNELTVKDIPLIPDELWLEISDLKGKKGSRAFSPIEKVETVAHWVNTGSDASVSKITGINRCTIGRWRNNSSWWPKVILCFYRMKEQKIEATLINTIESGSDQLLDRAKNGEYVYDAEGNMRYEKDEDGLKLDDDGNPIPKRKKLSAHSLAVDTIAIPQEKLAVLRGTSPKDKKDTALETLKELRKLLHEVGVKALAKDITKDSTLIEQ